LRLVQELLGTPNWRRPRCTPMSASRGCRTCTTRRIRGPDPRQEAAGPAGRLTSPAFSRSVRNLPAAIPVDPRFFPPRRPGHLEARRLDPTSPRLPPMSPAFVRSALAGRRFPRRRHAPAARLHKAAAPLEAPEPSPGNCRRSRGAGDREPAPPKLVNDDLGKLMAGVPETSARAHDALAIRGLWLSGFHGNYRRFQYRRCDPEPVRRGPEGEEHGGHRFAKLKEGGKLWGLLVPKHGDAKARRLGADRQG